MIKSNNQISSYDKFIYNGTLFHEFQNSVAPRKKRNKSVTPIPDRHPPPPPQKKKVLSFDLATFFSFNQNVFVRQRAFILSRVLFVILRYVMLIVLYTYFYRINNEK